MFFQVTNLEENNIQGNVTKVIANLSTGVIEVLEGHIAMIGLINDEILISESIMEGRVIRKEFLIRKGVIIISNDGPKAEDPKGTYVVVHAKEMIELTGNRNEKTMDELAQKLEKKKTELDRLLGKVNLVVSDLIETETRIKIFKGRVGIKLKNGYEEVRFFEKALSVIKEIRK